MYGFLLVLQIDFPQAHLDTKRPATLCFSDLTVCSVKYICVCVSGGACAVLFGGGGVCVHVQMPPCVSELSPVPCALYKPRLRASL